MGLLGTGQGKGIRSVARSSSVMPFWRVPARREGGGEDGREGGLLVFNSHLIYMVTKGGRAGQPKFDRTKRTSRRACIQHKECQKKWRGRRS